LTTGSVWGDPNHRTREKVPASREKGTPHKGTLTLRRHGYISLGRLRAGGSRGENPLKVP